MSQKTDKKWELTQIFHHNQSDELFTTLSFDQTGNYFAAGDSLGKIWIYDCPPTPSKQTDKENEQEDLVNKKEIEKNLEENAYRFYGQFQSHEPGFDYLKSMEIEESIQLLCWCQRTHQSHFLLSTNEKNIKLWKIYETAVKKGVDLNPENDTSLRLEDIRIPRLEFQETITAVTCKKVYKNAHAYTVNSISLNSDGETFLSGDDLRINLWSLNNDKESYNVVDLKPEDMDSLSEVITQSKFHPRDCQLFAYGTNKGSLKVNDMRVGSDCSRFAREIVPHKKNADIPELKYFPDIINSVLDFNFMPDGVSIVSRNCVSLQLWDSRKTEQVVTEFHVHPGIVKAVPLMFDKEVIFNKFDCAVALHGESVMTGQYGDSFLDWNPKENVGRYFEITDDECVERMGEEKIDFSSGRKTSEISRHPGEEVALVSNGSVINLLKKF